MAVCRQPVQGPRHLLFLLCHGDVHQGAGLSDRGSTGQSPYISTGFYCISPDVNSSQCISIELYLSLLILTDLATVSNSTPLSAQLRELVMCAHLHGGGRGAAPHRPHPVLLQDLQRPGPVATRRQLHLRLQGQRGSMSAGEREEGERDRGGRKLRNWVREKLAPCRCP